MAKIKFSRTLQIYNPRVYEISSGCIYAIYMLFHLRDSLLLGTAYITLNYLSTGGSNLTRDTWFWYAPF